MPRDHPRPRTPQAISQQKGGTEMSLVRGVLLAGRFRTFEELNSITDEDRRNTLIVELANRTNQPVHHYQAMDDATLAGAGAVLVFLRLIGARNDEQLKTISDDDQRNLMIIALGVQTGLSGPRLQSLSNLELASEAFGFAHPVKPPFARLQFRLRDFGEKE